MYLLIILWHTDDDVGLLPDMLLGPYALEMYVTFLYPLTKHNSLKENNLFQILYSSVLLNLCILWSQTNMYNYVFIYSIDEGI